MAQSGEPVPVTYSQLLTDVVAEVRAARIRAGEAVNAERTRMYWRIGQLIMERRESQGWGTGVISQLAADLAAQFPGMRGWSPRNLQYMRSLAVVLARREDLATAVAQLPWGHITVLIDRVAEMPAFAWYVEQAVGHDWSRATLVHHITTDRHARMGQAPDNFTHTVAPADRDRVREVIADPYALDFLAIDPGFSERQLEDALIGKLSAFLSELGSGFAFVGRQYRLPVGNRDYFADLLFFHLGLRRFVVFELKVGEVEPEHVGKLAFYVTAVDDLVRRVEHGDGPTIGILLAATRDEIVVEYALRTVDAPVAVATYTTDRTLPDDLRQALPSREALTGVLRDHLLDQASDSTGKSSRKAGPA